MPRESSVARLRLLDGLPYAPRLHRHLEVPDTDARERVDGGVDDRGAGRDRARLADALDPERVRGGWRDGARRVEARQLGRRRDHVFDERAREDLTALVVDRLLVEGLRDGLRDAAVHLPVDDHRIDHVAAVVDRRVALDYDLARLAVDLDLGDVRAEREREVRRVVERRGLEVRLHARGHGIAGPGGIGQLLDGLGALGRALDLPLRARPLEIVGRAFEQMRCNQARLVAHLPARQLQGRAAHGQRARAVGPEAVRRLPGVAVDDVDLVERDAELALD